MMTAAALLFLAMLAFVRGPEQGLTATVATMAKVFHGVLLLALLASLARIPALTHGREDKRGFTIATLGLAGLAGLGLLARDFGII